MRTLARDPYRNPRSSTRTPLCRFVALNEALGLTDEIPTPILDDLRNRAHRLSGTAAIFEFSGIAAATRTLELTATSASSHRGDSEPAVSMALAALVRLIAGLKKPARAV
jgi:HPt (histidine-containing phosphotransfer) domain-containing protein